MRKLLVLGFVGAFAGATFLASLDGDAPSAFFLAPMGVVGGGVVAAPLAAWLVKHLAARARPWVWPWRGSRWRG